MVVFPKLVEHASEFIGWDIAAVDITLQCYNITLNDAFQLNLFQTFEGNDKYLAQDIPAIKVLADATNDSTISSEHDVEDIAERKYMLKQVSDGVWTHESDFLQSQTVVVQGKKGVLLIDPGITNNEMAEIADDLHGASLPIVAGFSTHPHWDHVLWSAQFGEVPRYGTAANAREMRDFLSKTDWKVQVIPMLPPNIAEQIPLDDLFGKITGLPAGTTYLPWDGPKVRVIEHQAHAVGHAALLIEESGVLVVGDILSDILIPFLDLEATDPAGDYLAALQWIENVADDVEFVITGHGTVGRHEQLRERIRIDRTYVEALRSGGGSDDPRLTAGPNKDWLPGVHEWQVKQLTQKEK